MLSGCGQPKASDVGRDEQAAMLPWETDLTLRIVGNQSESTRDADASPAELAICQMCRESSGPIWDELRRAKKQLDRL